MEHLAKIVQEQWLTDKQVWKYGFIDIQTNQQDFFYHDKQMSYVLNIAGKLKISIDKFFQSFKQDLTSLIKEKVLINSEKEVDDTVGKIIRKHRKISVELEHLKHLRKLGFSYPNLATVYKKCERTIYRWFKPSEETFIKEGS